MINNILTFYLVVLTNVTVPPPGASMQRWPSGCVLVSKQKPLHSSAGAKRISLLRDMPAPYEDLFIFVIESVFIICLNFYQVLSY